ncbi:lipocalin-like protein [Aquimarina sp. MAR_2010_214]|uniref:lipocalin family protein n=1 Tax=Aquimarina sp. MAR_2010_214 TaxID=1250026 RepID=UPI000C701013|nr:lipocalin family protein [Aquimarina sp. MAR_2010_214]PKV52852.1 lipocalin-like protein [Aquimarina sp. MAR_2010_214]
MSKKLIVFVLIGLSMNFSCNTDDDVVGTINETFIIGQWQLTSSTKNGTNVDLGTCDLMETYVFDKSNKVSITLHTLNANNICEEGSKTTYDYSITNKNLTISNNSTFVISTSENAKLILTSKSSSDTFVNTYKRK